jgi:hypothetical protein
MSKHRSRPRLCRVCNKTRTKNLNRICNHCRPRPTNTEQLADAVFEAIKW